MKNKTSLFTRGVLLKTKRNLIIGILVLVVIIAAIMLLARGSTPNAVPEPTPTTAASAIPTQTVPDLTQTQSPISTAIPITNSTPVYAFDDTDWWDHAVFYEIFVRSFYDSNGDGIGDFNGITQKLDYLNDGDPSTTTDLGVTAIWLMPIFPSPSYHGYDVTDYRTVNPDYGTIEDFTNMVNEAHKRGIHVIIDFVINHTSDQNPWFKASLDSSSPYHDWYIWSPFNPGYLGPWGEQVWHKASNDLYYYGVFTGSMPDLNYRTQAVTDEMESIAKFWLTEENVDGFRVDGARHLIEDGSVQVNTPETLTWFKDFRSLYKEWKPAAMTIGEVWDTSYATTKYLNDQSFDMVFDFDLSSALLTTIGISDANSLSGSIQSEVQLYQDRGMGTFLTNHDMNRVMSQLGGDINRARHAATVLLTIPGSPFVYYGEEIGMVGEKPDEQIRTPMQWSSGEEAGFTTSGSAWEMPNFSYKTVNVDAESQDQDSLLSLYRNLINIRTRHPALLTGSYVPVQTSDPSLYAALSTNGNETLLTVVNLSGNPISAPIFTFSDSRISGSYSLSLLLGTAAIDTSVTVTASGSNSSIQFTNGIDANQNLIFQLTAQ